MQVNEIFYSLEGEGLWQGYPTIFIRLAGCNLDCSWCDTDHKLKADLDYAQIHERIKEYPCRRVKITGGEPCIQDSHLSGLIKMLKDNNYIVALETNGTIYDPISFMRVDLICMDIKTPSSNEESDFSVISRTNKKYGDKTEFKMVISDETDLKYAEPYALLDNVLLMPNSQSEFKGELIYQMKNKFPECRFGLRLHEVLGIR